ncbi:aldo/keto reductase family oxidoreductase [Virgibacillus kekensis]|uniref:Aldo/keto reductase family oxidoreductase n=1 Tax=Virgibacillus kekensis TaxID=202261 RepID=A0ABV9DMG4_9BACI
MNKIDLGNSGLVVSEIGLGCMRMKDLSVDMARQVIERSIESGIDFFDHADIYGQGKAEEIFAEAFKGTQYNRDDIVLQTKCGIRKGFFDFSKEHILNAVDGSLSRLNTGYIDILLLHRPDTLMEPEEVAEAFTKLSESGKVRYFGVSNQNPMQIDLLKKYLKQDLIVNQLQFGLMHTGMIDAGLNVNMTNEPALLRDGSVLEYSRLNNMTIQAWSPFQYGMMEGVFIGNERFPELNAKLDEFAEAKGITNSAVAATWILHHPAKIQPIVGSMNPERLRGIAEATNVKMTREEWYELYRAAGNNLP